MTELDARPPSLTFPTASLSAIEPVRRLIVLIPEGETDYTFATRRIWELASAFEAHVQFLGLCKDAVQEPSLRRQLVTMCALVQDGRISAEARVEIGTDWVNVVRSNWKGDDVIVCFAEQRAGLTRRPLSQILESNLNATVYVLSGLYQSGRPRLNWMSGITAWSGSIGIILGFFWLQIKIDHLGKDWVHTVLLLLSIPVEIWLIWVWNSLFG